MSIKASSPEGCKKAEDLNKKRNKKLVDNSSINKRFANRKGKKDKEEGRNSLIGTNNSTDRRLGQQQIKEKRIFLRKGTLNNS